MVKKFVIWDDELKQLGSASSFGRQWIKDLFNAPFWENIPDKPTEFPPAPHTHTMSDITDLATHTHTRDDITDFFNAPFWENIPDKPTSYPPESHTHDISEVEVTSLPDWTTEM